MRMALAVLLALVATPAYAQVPTYPPVDAEARSAAAGALAAAQAACQPMAAVPPVEVPGGTTGSGVNCRLVNAADNRISRTGLFSYNASGAVLCGGLTTCTWATALPSGAASYPVFVTAVGAGATPSVRCKVTSSTNTGFTGMTCAQASSGIVIGGLVEITTGLTPGTVFVLSLPATQANQ